MHAPVARLGQSDQVLLSVAAGSTAPFLVVDLKVLFAAAGLTAPGVALKYLRPELAKGAKGGNGRGSVDQRLRAA